MFKLHYGYLLSGIITGCVLLFTYVGTIPDGKLHIVFCDVGQGDGAYIRFPDGRDMVVDGGPNNKILDCLGRYMPFWDRHINIVVMTHPEKDHIQGLIGVVQRFRVDYVVRSDVESGTEGYARFGEAIQAKHVPVRFLSRGGRITVGATSLTFLWPSPGQIAKGKGGSANSRVLGVETRNLNDYGLVFALRYGSFDALFTADTDTRVNKGYVGDLLGDDRLEVLKVPHHGSRTGMDERFVSWSRPQVAVISSGKNSYGHPTPEVIALLSGVGARVLRTDRAGDIRVVSDGRAWKILD